VKGNWLPLTVCLASLTMMALGKTISSTEGEDDDEAGVVEVVVEVVVVAAAVAGFSTDAVVDSVIVCSTSISQEISFQMGSRW